MKTIFPLLLLSSVILFGSCERRPPDGRPNHQSTRAAQREQISRDGSNSSGPCVVHMRKAGGVYMIPVKLDGTEMDVIFDTGASSVVISCVEATFLMKQGKLTQDDIVGDAYFQTADGNVSVGTVVILHSVQIGNRVIHNIEASVVDNMDAPLLLGQTAMSKFGKISIDYQRNTITLE